MINVIIASQVHRLRLLQQIVDSLNNQSMAVDSITIIMQGYTERLERDKKVKYIRLQKNTGSIARFRHAMPKAINITIDDDFIPSEGYVKHLVEALERTGGIVSLWGYHFPNGVKYECYNSWDKQEQDIRCIMLGCGLMAWDEGELNLRNVRFDNPNRCDVQVAIHAANNWVPMYCVARAGNEAVHVPDEDIQKGAIWRDIVNDKRYQIENVEKLINIFAS